MNCMCLKKIQFAKNSSLDILAKRIEYCPERDYVLIGLCPGLGLEIFQDFPEAIDMS